MKTCDFMALVNLAEDDAIEYISGLKYQVYKDMIVKTGLRPPKDIVTDMVILRDDGWLLICRGFATDGPSGPTIDTNSNVRAAIIHDALYYLMRLGLLPLTFRFAADGELYRFMVKDGCHNWRARLYEFAVRKFGFNAAAIRRKVFRSPK